MNFTFAAVGEDGPGAGWQRLFNAAWPAYRRWFLRDGIAQRATYLEGLRAIKSHMPELRPLYEQLCDLAGGGDLPARFLSLYRPPPYLAGCSQAVWPGPAPLLVRNYDYSPQAFEGLLLKTRWLGKNVMGMSDCLIGLLDGINEDGLAVSLTFGGRRVVGEGFGVPLILRYVLETCATAAEGAKVLARVPCHMAYNVTLLDAGGHHATLFLAPDREAVVTELPAATNHQERIEWTRHARATGTVQRERFILDRLLQQFMSDEGFIAAFLKTPLYAHAFNRGFGTLYTAAYRPQERALTLHWPDAAWRFTLDGFAEQSWSVRYPMAA